VLLAPHPDDSFVFFVVGVRATQSPGPPSENLVVSELAISIRYALENLLIGKLVDKKTRLVDYTSTID